MTRRIIAAALVALAACSNGDPAAPKNSQNGACVAGSALSLDLPVGGVRLLSNPAQVGCAQIAAATTATNYLFVAANANPVPDVFWNFTIQQTSGFTPQRVGDLEDAVTQRARSAAMTVAPPEWGYRDRMEARLRAEEHRLDLADGRAFWQAREAQRARSAAPRASANVVVATAPVLGDTLSFRVPDTTSACTKFFTISAVVKAVSEHAIIVQDTAAPSAGFSTTEFTDIANEFDRIIYATDTLHFGSPGDLDLNGRVLILYTPRVNSETAKGSKGFIGGFFFGGDLFPRRSCNQSNGAEIFYLLAPDPTGVFSDPRSVNLVRQLTRGTIAHEFQHMINLAVRLRGTGADDEADWLNEALSHFAEEVVGRAEDGYGDMQKLGIDEIADRANNFANFNAFFVQNLLRLSTWMERPDTSGATSKHADVDLSVRGAAWSLLRWTTDQFGSADVPSFTRRLVAGPDTGVSNLTARAGMPFDTLVAGWLLANAVSDIGVPGLLPRYTYLSWNFRSALPPINSGSYPLLITDLLPAVPVGTAVPSASGDYFRVTSAPSTPATVVRITAPGGGAITTAGARLYVVRLP
ncbi:MAG: hypothetical protein M3068_08645 [Gemmatimonadota bacterium]|nr:hypothetical protein [Gemmatimonadota bacterium]